jgi:hypothetical protein
MGDPDRLQKLPREQLYREQTQAYTQAKRAQGLNAEVWRRRDNERRKQHEQQIRVAKEQIEVTREQIQLAKGQLELGKNTLRVARIAGIVAIGMLLTTFLPSKGTVNQLTKRQDMRTRLALALIFIMLCILMFL